jgi:hypothetical protein
MPINDQRTKSTKGMVEGESKENVVFFEIDKIKINIAER